MTTLLLSAGDASGDAHAADFVRAFRERDEHATFFGLGGPRMERAGVELIVHQRDLAVGGVIELLGSGSTIASAWRRMGQAVAERSPDLVVLVDSGGFNLPLARRIRRSNRAPILYYVAPQVWAWRKGRIRKLEDRVDRMAVIFPFEAEFYADSALRVDYVGHPQVETLRALAKRLDARQARELLGLRPDGQLVALLPGSRRNEMAHHLPIQLESARLMSERTPNLEFALGLAPSIERTEVEKAVDAADLPAELSIDVVEGHTPELIRAADVVLAKPGTVTVEITLLERPMVVMGHANALTAAILRRAVHLPSLTMPNLIAQDSIVPEFLQQDALPSAIAQSLEQLLAGPERERQLAALRDVAAKLGDGGAAARSAEIAREMLSDAAA